MPPRLITGITLLFWGAMTGHAFLGLIAALLVEARNWIPLRWHFNQQGYVRAWHYSILCGALIAILAWFDGLKVNELHTLFVWVPLVFLPIELAMRYGRADEIPLHTFSFFARKNAARNEAFGRVSHSRMVNTGFFYIALCLLATAIACRNQVHHFIGFHLICAATLWAYVRPYGLRPKAWISATVLVIALSFIGQWAFFKFYHYAGHGGDQERSHISANESRTNIGQLGKLKLNPKIFWRMETKDSMAPPLLRVATYNEYKRTRWKYRLGIQSENSQRDNKGYLTSDRFTDINQDIRYFSEEDEVKEPEIQTSNPIRVIGEVSTAVLENPIPLPQQTQAIGGIGALSEKASIEVNPLATVHLINPDYNVIEYKVWQGNYPQSAMESAPNSHYDLQVPASERAAIRRINQSLGMKQLTDHQKVAKLRQFFNDHFTYSTHLTTPAINNRQRASIIGTFLESSQAGHCEYFATATVLMLRDSGVPARYCVGFSAREYNGEDEQWIMRGKHAHAWCRVWIDGRWHDVDLTPPSWESLEEANSDLWQRRLADWWQTLREDFIIWRSQKSNRSGTLTVATSLISLLLLWLAWRLWKARKTRLKSHRKIYQRPTGVSLTALNALEPRIAKIIGPRPLGTPLCLWIARLPTASVEKSENDSEQRDCELLPLIEEINELHSKIRFDSQGGTDEEQQQQQLLSLCRELRQRLKSRRSL